MLESFFTALIDFRKFLAITNFFFPWVLPRYFWQLFLLFIIIYKRLFNWSVSLKIPKSRIYFVLIPDEFK